MKKNFITVAALMVTAFFVATEIAQAADVSFSGQLRTRYEINEQSDFNDTTEADDFTAQRTRLAASVNVNDSTSAFIQLQSVRSWGNSASTAGGSGNNAPGNDGDSSVGVHQAYFTLKNFATLPVDLKIGRQEVVLDGHRLFGHTGWATGGQSHEAVRLTHAHDNMSLMYAWITTNEDGAPTGDNINDRNDVENHLVYFSYAGVLGGKFSAIYNWTLDGCGATSSCNNLANDIHTIGFRQAGQLYGIDYRGEYYYQGGDGTADLGTSVSTDRDAYMFGVRLGKSFKNVMMKPSLTLWYDYLSGTDDADRRANEWKSFNTLFDTGHKFYGLMDQYGTIGGGAGAGINAGLGLQDLAIKAKLSPMPGWTLKMDYHWFWLAEGLAANNTNDGSVTSFAQTNSNDLGNELDITLTN